MEHHAAGPAQPTASRPARRKRALRRLLFGALALVVLLCLSLAAIRASVTYYRLDGESMRPCLGPGQTLRVNKAVYVRVGSRYLVHPPRRGEIVVFFGPGRVDIKRVIGLPGERVAMRDGRVYIDGSPLDEPYVALSAGYTYPPRDGEQPIPAGMLFVLGDNRNNSADSHIYGPVALDRVIGRVATSCTPPTARR